MSDNFFHFAPAVHALGTFPVTQQGMGAVCAVVGLGVTIYWLAKLIFDGIKKLGGSKDVYLPDAIRVDKEGIHDGLSALLFGLVTFTPVVGTITNAVLWYKVTHDNQEPREVRYARTRVGQSI